MQTPVFENKFTTANLIQIVTIIVMLTGFGISLKSGLATLSEKVAGLSTDLARTAALYEDRLGLFDGRLRTMEVDGALRERRIEELESDIERLLKGASN